MAIAIRSTRRWSPQSGRESLVYGDYEPSRETAGLLVPDYTHLTEWNSPATNAVTLPDGFETDGKIIYGKVTPAGNGEVHNVYMPGSNLPLASGNDGVLSATHDRTGIFRIYDSEIAPRAESVGRNCALGKQYELHRTHMHGGEDGWGAYNTTGPDANVKVKGCLVEDMAYGYPDRDHPDGGHPDGGQIQGGRIIEAIGNAVHGTGHWITGSGLYYPTHNTVDLGDWPLTMTPPRNPGAGIIVNGNVADMDETVIIDANYFRWCKAMLLIKNLATGGIVVTNNRFSYTDSPSKNVNGTVHNGTSLNFTSNEYRIRLDSLSATPNITGLVSGGVLANTTNVWLDGPNVGQPLAYPRASGIHYDAA